MGIIGEKSDIDVVISTGDNFYEDGLTGVDDPTFGESFSKIYTAPSLQKQWYNVLGNHDYRGNVEAQLSPVLTGKDRRWLCLRSFLLDAGIVEFFSVDTTPFVDKYFTDPGEVPVIPRQDKPMLVGYIDKYCDVKDPLFSALLDRYRLGSPYVCVSLLKDCYPETDHGLAPGFGSKNSMPGVKGKELFHRLHKVGTLCKIKHFWADSICLAGLRRVRLTEMVNYDAVSGGLLTVKVDHLKDLPFNKDDAEINFLSRCLKHFLEECFLLDGEQIKDVNECDCQQFSDYVARFGIPTMCKFELQDFLEELDVHKRLTLMGGIIDMLVEDRDLY